MWQIEVFGEKAGQASWHLLPQIKNQRTLALAETKQLTDPQIYIPPDLMTGDSCVITTNRSMVQLAGKSKYTTSVAVIENNQQVKSDTTIYYAALIIKQLLPSSETTIIQGSRWKNLTGCIEVFVKHNGKPRLKEKVNIAGTVCLDLDHSIIFRPGDILEVSFRKNHSTIDRVSANFGLKKSA